MSLRVVDCVNPLNTASLTATTLYNSAPVLIIECWAISLSVYIWLHQCFLLGDVTSKGLLSCGSIILSRILKEAGLVPYSESRWKTNGARCKLAVMRRVASLSPSPGGREVETNKITRKLRPHTYTDLLRAGAARLVFITDMPRYHKCLFWKFQAPSSPELWAPPALRWVRIPLCWIWTV